MECDPEKELAFNLEQHERWLGFYPNVRFRPYTGPFAHLDLEQTWFCPRCRDINKPLVLSNTGKTLFCTAHYEQCEYSYSNFEERVKRESYLDKRYSLPLSLLEVTEREIDKLNKEQQKIQIERQRLDNREQEIESHIIKLKRTLK